MPLVVVSGLPCSGKTRRVAELVEYVETHLHDKQIQVGHVRYEHGRVCFMEVVLHSDC